jgi:Phytanoyl-CoA dioxygenase (PhyH)
MGTLSKILRDPRLAYYFAQKAIRNPRLRHGLGRALITLLPKPTVGHTNSTTLSELERLGIAYLPSLQLDAQTIAQVMDHYAGKPVLDLYSGTKLESINNLSRQYTKVQYTDQDTAACQPLVALANHPNILAAVGQYLGAKPRISTMQTWWTYGEHSQTGQTHFDDVYHRDVDDLRFVKLFVYLTDTSLTTGAHSFIKGSHCSAALTRRGPISDHDAAQQFSNDQFETVIGPAGTVFLEDTWGIHRPLLATQGRRLIFSVLYGLTDWIPQRPKQAVLPLPEGLDHYTNRAYFHPS